MTNSNQRAFTMIEVLAALAILSISMVVLIRGQTRSMDNVRKVRNYEEAVFTTENQLHWTFLDLNEIDDWREYSNLDGQDEGSPFKWRVTIQAADMERESQVEMTMLKIVATTTWMEGEAEKSFSLETWYFWGEEKQ